MAEYENGQDTDAAANASENFYQSLAPEASHVAYEAWAHRDKDLTSAENSIRAVASKSEVLAERNKTLNALGEVRDLANSSANTEEQIEAIDIVSHLLSDNFRHLEGILIQSIEYADKTAGDAKTASTDAALHYYRNQGTYENLAVGDIQAQRGPDATTFGDHGSSELPPLTTSSSPESTLDQAQ